ncbi:hypothetical protein D3C80_1154160 [compost metagenome]
MLISLAAFLVDGRQLDVADVGSVQRGFADPLDVCQVLVIGVLGAVQQDLRQACFRVARSAPLIDLLLRIGAGETLRVLQVEHRQRDQGVALAIGEGFFQQGFGFLALGFGSVRLGCQQAAEAGLGAWRDIGGGAVGGFGFLELGRVAGFHLDIGQADLGFAVTEVGELAVILFGEGGVTALERFVGQALVGQAGATGEADGQGQAAQTEDVVRPLWEPALPAKQGAALPIGAAAQPIAGKAGSHGEGGNLGVHRHVSLRAHGPWLYRSANPATGHGCCPPLPGGRPVRWAATHPA